jgi:glucans biosynthesis protein C
MGVNRAAKTLPVCVFLIVLVVAHHSVEAYVTAHPPEIPMPDPPLARAWVFLWVNAAFFMGLFFLAGYFTSGAFERKGAAAFLADRGLRLGLPLVLGTVLIVPLAGWAHIALDPAMPPIGYWTYLTQDFFLHAHGPKPDVWPRGERWPGFNFGHLWFLEHLLVYAVLYAALRLIARRDRGLAVRSPPSHRAIFGYAVLLAAVTFVIRIWYPQNRWIAFLGFIQMEPAHIAQYAGLFAIGVVAGPRRWLETMPARRGLLWLAVGVGLALIAYLLAGTGAIAGGATDDSDSRGWRVCTYEAFLCAGLCVGLPVLFRELALGVGRVWHVLAANVFAVYVFHTSCCAMGFDRRAGAEMDASLCDCDRRDRGFLRLHQLGDFAAALRAAYLLSLTGTALVRRARQSRADNLGTRGCLYNFSVIARIIRGKSVFAVNDLASRIRLARSSM